MTVPLWLLAVLVIFALIGLLGVLRLAWNWWINEMIFFMDAPKRMKDKIKSGEH